LSKDHLESFALALNTCHKLADITIAVEARGV